MGFIEIDRTPYSFDQIRQPEFKQLADRVMQMRDQGKLTPEVLYRIRKHFRIKNIYHSNAIEGNLLKVSETRQVVELGLIITGKPLKDQTEARNLSHALDYLEELAGDSTQPISEIDIHQIHSLVLQGLAEEAGSYRTEQVEISGSKFFPPGPEKIPADMAEIGNWLAQVSVPSEDTLADVTGLFIAAAAHTWFVTTHPFIDGNGRVARLLMNLLLMRYGFPIAIVTRDDRLRYYDALEISRSTNLTPFIDLVADCVSESLDEYEAAAREQRENKEWAQSIAETYTTPDRVIARNEYEIWRSAMELLRSFLKQTTDRLAIETGIYGNVKLKDFGSLEFEKYVSLRNGISAKRSWFSRIDFERGRTTSRYLFFFGHPSREMSGRCNVTIHVARETPINSLRHERLENINEPHIPSLCEIGYEIQKEQFAVRYKNRLPQNTSLETWGRRFFEEVMNNPNTN